MNGVSNRGHDGQSHNSVQEKYHIINGMSVDVEEWFQVGAFENVIRPDDWAQFEYRVERNIHSILALFNDAGIRATFFTLGWIARRHCGLLRAIADEGHELASHGWDHQRVFRQNASGFRADIRAARVAIEDASGQAVSGYRAPSFSIDRQTPWAHAVLAEEGYRYSSSVSPMAHDHYGWAEAPRFAFYPVQGADLVEIPVTTAELAGRRLGAGGGGFFRVLPYGYSRWAINQVNRKKQRPAAFYFHPWEIDPEQPRVAGASVRSSFRHYTGLGRMRPKLQRLLQDFQWGRMDHLAEAEAAYLRAAADLQEAV